MLEKDRLRSSCLAGPTCDTNYNGCDDGADCGKEDNCVDLSPLAQQTMEKSYICRECPDGYEMNQNQCKGIGQTLHIYCAVSSFVLQIV